MAETTKATRFLIYSTNDGGENLTLVGEVNSSGAEPALREFFKEEGATGTFTAVSENAMKLRRRSVEPTPRVKVEDAGTPRRREWHAVEVGPVREDETAPAQRPESLSV